MILFVGVVGFISISSSESISSNLRFVGVDLLELLLLLFASPK
jgi:hypothetical protein